MASTTITVGELIYDVTINFTKVTEYGVSMEALVTGQAPPPPEGARVQHAIAVALKLSPPVGGGFRIHPPPAVGGELGVGSEESSLQFF